MEHKKTQADAGALVVDKLLVLEQQADFPTSSKIAEERGGSLPKLKDFILGLKSDPKLYEKAKGKYFWLGDEQESHFWNGIFCKIDYENGLLVPVAEGEWDGLPAREKAYVSKGGGHLVLGIGDHGGSYFTVYGYLPSSAKATAVAIIGVCRNGEGHSDPGAIKAEVAEMKEIQKKMVDKAGAIMEEAKKVEEGAYDIMEEVMALEIKIKAHKKALAELLRNQQA